METSEKALRGDLNFRELGGIRVKDGRTVRHGLLYRSGGLHLFTDEELEYVRSLGIVSILDLRAWYDWKKKPDPDIGAVHLEYDGKTAKGGEKIDFSARGFSKHGKEAQEQLKALSDYYRNMPFENSGYQAMMKALLKREVPLLFHCTTGKDRTGIAAMVILYVLGADDREIMEDYLLSNTFRAEAISSFMAAENLKYPQDEGYCTLTMMRGGVMKEMGEAALRELHRRYDSPLSYVRGEYGWKEEELDSFRNDFLEF